MINLNITLVIQLVIVLTVMVLLNQILFKPVLRILEERKARTEGRRKAAGELDGRSEAMWSDYQKRLQEARAQADRSRSEFVRQAEEERQRITEEAAGEAEKAVSAVRARIRAEAADARKLLEAEAKRLADSAAQKILGRSV
ncbi:MAG: ATP synthase F0 subunit B [Deltaproteobacteria bacterium]|nr:ATP synthase F0 subunit B [Deltaproteobacteria bacterium]